MNLQLLEREWRKYCRKNPAPLLNLGGCEQGVVIPCYDEIASIEATLQSLAAASASGEVAVILVINYPAGGEAASSRELWRQVKRGKFDFISHLFPLYAPELTGGVGAARKLGMDSFIGSLTPEKLLRARIFSLDADSWIAPEYFTRINAAFDAPEAPLGVIPGVQHRKGETPELEAAIRRYERYLDRYASKMREAHSPYSFHTIGSAIAVTAVGYWRSGGMKVRTAGEDFYFLQELAKVGTVVELPEKLVFPAARESARVPFGTGPALTALLRGESLNEVPDAAFEQLQKLLAQVPNLATGVETFWDKLPEVAQEFLKQEKFGTVWPKIVQNTPQNEGALIKAFHRWFDGLKSLRFLHYCSR